MKVAAIVPAAGLGKRLRSKSVKALVRVGGKPLLALTLERLKSAYPFQEMIVAAHPSSINRYRLLLAAYGLSMVKIVAGGRSRAASVLNGVNATSETTDWVLVHDAARPLVTRDLVRRLLQAAQKSGAAICALPATATVKRVDPANLSIEGTEDRRSLYLAQTPQVFKRKLLLERYQKLGKKVSRATDEAALFDHTKTRVKVVLGDERNIKITTPADLKLVEYYLKDTSL